MARRPGPLQGVYGCMGSVPARIKFFLSHYGHAGGVGLFLLCCLCTKPNLVYKVAVFAHMKEKHW